MRFLSPQLFYWLWGTQQRVDQLIGLFIRRRHLHKQILDMAHKIIPKVGHYRFMKIFVQIAVRSLSVLFETGNIDHFDIDAGSI
jgi:hypothetical protein